MELMEGEKRGKLIELIEEEEGTMLVFCSTQNTRLCAKMIANAGFKSGELHSGLIKATFSVAEAIPGWRPPYSGGD